MVAYPGGAWTHAGRVGPHGEWRALADRRAGVRPHGGALPSLYASNALCVAGGSVAQLAQHAGGLSISFALLFRGYAGELGARYRLAFPGVWAPRYEGV